MKRLLFILLILMSASTQPQAQSNTCHLDYSASSTRCSQEKERLLQRFTYESVVKTYNKCLDKALSEQKCCNMQDVVRTKNSGSDKGSYIVMDGFNCVSIANRNGKPECIACEESCKAKMKDAGGMASSCKSLCANNNRLNCKE